MSEQIRDLHVAQREEDIGFYAGFLGKICCHKVSKCVFFFCGYRKVLLSNKNHAYFFSVFENDHIFEYHILLFRCIIYDRQRSCVSLLGYHS